MIPFGPRIHLKFNIFDLHNWVCWIVDKSQIMLHLQQRIGGDIICRQLYLLGEFQMKKKDFSRGLAIFDKAQIIVSLVLFSFLVLFKVPWEIFMPFSNSLASSSTLKLENKGNHYLQCLGSILTWPAFVETMPQIVNNNNIPFLI